jgi:hypothetical protein
METTSINFVTTGILTIHHLLNLRYDIYLELDAGSILSMTRAWEPPRSKTFPVAVTFWPANGRSLSFWPDEGVASEMGQ